MGKRAAAASDKRAGKLKNVAGMHAMGEPAGLYLVVDNHGGASWILRYMLDGRRRDMGLGGASDITLSEARELARVQRKLIVQGVDPVEARREVKLARQRDQAKVLTFRQCCAKYLSAHSDEWSNAEHREQWRQTLETYAGPVIGQLNVAHVDDALVLQILEPIWKTKTETAKRLRGRIERVLGWATVHKYRTGDNPARWRGHLDHMLAKPSKIVQTKNHPALPYFRVAELMAELRAKRSVGARALQFLILTAARSGEVRGAEWSEIDFANGIWTVPAARMKMRVEHRVPLSAQALAVLEQMREQQMGAFIFPGRREGEVMSDMTLVSVLRRMGHPDIVPHGFRSTFRDWAAECTGYPRELAEVALAHKVGDETERAYQRGDLLEKRRRLMRDWAAWCDRPATPATVTSIRHG